MINNQEIEIDSSASANVVEEGPAVKVPTVSLPKGAIKVAFQVDDNVKIVHAYPDMPRPRNLKIPSLYELMTAPSLDIWEDSEESDESADEWSTVTKRVQHRPLFTKSSAPTGVKIRGRPPLKNKKKKKRAPKKAKAPQEEEYEQSPRVPITLREFLPKELLEDERKEEENEEVVECCMVTIGIAGESDTEADKKEDQDKSEPVVNEIVLHSGSSIPSADKKKEAGSTSEKLKKLKLKPTSENVIDKSHKTSTASTSTNSVPEHTKSKGKESAGKYKYDVLAHLKRVPATLSVFEALQMSRELREALIEALTCPDIYKDEIEEVAVTTPRVCIGCKECIMFCEDDLLLGSEYHNRPLYVTGLVGDTMLIRILLDGGSAVNLLPLKTLRMMGMSPKQLSPSLLTIQGYNQSGQRAMGTIALQMEIGELYSDALFHVIDAPTSFNVLLGRPWLHTYGIVPSTLHQCFKFRADGVVKKVLADVDPFKGEEVNYSDAKFYKSPVVSASQPSKARKSRKAEVVQHKTEATKPSRPVRVKVITSSSEKDALTSKVTKPKVIFKYLKEDQREPGQKALTTVKDTMETLMTSYTKPLRKVDQSIPEGNMVISTVLEKNERQNHRFVSFRNMSSAPLRVNPKKLKKNLKSSPLRITVQQVDGMLKVRIPKIEASKCKLSRISVFRRLGTQTPPRVSVFQRLAIEGQPRVSALCRLNKNLSSLSNKSQTVKKWQAKRWVKVIFKKSTRRKMNKEAEESLSVNCVSYEEQSSEEEDEEFIDIAEPAPPQIEDGGQATIDGLQEINLGTVEEPKPIFVSALLTPDELGDYKSLLQEYIDVFAWGYQDMPGLDPNVAVHKLAVSEEKRWVKQAPRRFRSELAVQIESEVDKLIDVGFIREVKYLTWLASIVPVKKKNGQIRICVDYRDLNDACPKDEFPLPITELLVDATTGYSALSFMDGFSGYNQIKMAPEDEELTAFRTPKGVYCYTVMSFGLKNAGATYQRAMTYIFADMLHNTVECYVDDLVVKTRKRQHHLADLRRVFERLRKYQLKMNPLKCAFGVMSGKFLGFVVRYRGIEVDPTKITAIREMPPPRDLRELRGLQGRLAYIRRFISNLSGRCQPFTRLMKKDVPFKWDQACQNAFDNIKEYLLKPPVLMAPIKGRPLILYIAALERSLGAMLAQNNDEGKENALYYLSRTLVGAEHNYTPIEKVCLALVFATQKLRHYMLAHSITLISKADPLRYLMSKPVLSGRLAKWSLLLSEFDIKFVSQKAIKGQALADFLAAHPVPDHIELPEDLPDEEVFSTEASTWQLYFDGAARTRGAGAGVIFITPSRGLIPYSFSLMAVCSNNVAEYEALIIGLEIALEMRIDALQAYGDSQLIVRQVNDEYAVRNENLMPYHQRVKYLMARFQEVHVSHIPRSENDKADALAKLAASLTLPNEKDIQITVGERRLLTPALERIEESYEAYAVTVFEVEEESDWRKCMIEYCQSGKLPSDPRKRVYIRRTALRFVYINDILYRRSFDGILLRCLSKEEAAHALRDTHSGICGAHQVGPKLAAQLRMRIGYYWPTMVQDAIHFARTCKACQIHGDFIHQPPLPLHPSILSYPFDTWVFDVMGPISPKSSRLDQYILAGTDNFSKWSEAIPLKSVKAEDVANFIRSNIIYRFGVPSKIISDNASYFKCKAMIQLCEKYNIQHSFSASYNPTANGQAEAFNKVLGNILKKMVSRNKRDWHERLPEALWAYRTTVRTATGCTPYSLVYGSEAVLPLEIQLPSPRIATQLANPDENARVRLAELEALDEKRLVVQQKLEIYQAQVAGAFNKKVKSRSFKVGDLVLTLRRPIIVTRQSKGKFEPKWEGPYVITKVFSKGAYELSNANGDCIYSCVNGKFVKKFYA
uniref:uncharacterized protein LOC101299390 n=1 Tax=Fragaria vesca subsp. vesca TaxID=101020 RepID=UPI0005C9698C|nr:PREDICTED: uncharacterized protein LOC101299390 [Fragaria vesca subsp. vesca]